MPITNGYATLAEFKARNEIDATTYDAEAERAVEAASRWVDNYCQRHFWQTAADTPRTFDACSPTVVDFGTYGDLTAIASLATDQDGDGTFETTWGASDYQLLPLRPSAAPEERPYRQALAIGGRTFPAPDATRVGRVQVTGTWGWAAVPFEVREACLIQASRLYKRRNSPEGVTGFGSEFGAIRLSARPDPDAVNLLKPYRLRPALIA